MKILLSGSSGLIGKELLSCLENLGHHVICLRRDRQKLKENTIFWDPEKGILDSSAVENFDAVIHLAGENIAARRWNEKQKQRILDSRIKGTTLLTQALCQIKNPPKVFISASAVGFYGDRGSELCTEETSCGSGFLANVCRQWESATKPVIERDIRTINLRTGIVLSTKGGALKKMLTPFKFGLGGKLGSGNQYMSWISIDDALNIILYVLINESIKGPINVVAPLSVTNAELTDTLGKVLHRPTLFNVPAFALNMIFGEEMSKECLLSSTRVEPLRLIQAGYPFLYPELGSALKHLLLNGEELE